jgi:hypothetical protein
MNKSQYKIDSSEAGAPGLPDRAGIVQMLDLHCVTGM